MPTGYTHLKGSLTWDARIQEDPVKPPQILCLLARKRIQRDLKTSNRPTHENDPCLKASRSLPLSLLFLSFSAIATGPQNVISCCLDPWDLCSLLRRGAGNSADTAGCLVSQFSGGVIFFENWCFCSVGCGCVSKQLNINSWCQIRNLFPGYDSMMQSHCAFACHNWRLPSWLSCLFNTKLGGSNRKARVGLEDKMMMSMNINDERHLNFLMKFPGSRFEFPGSRFDMFFFKHFC